MNIATIIVLLVVLGLIVLAIWAMRKGRIGSCCDGKSKKTEGDCASCLLDCPLKASCKDASSVTGNHNNPHP